MLGFYKSISTALTSISEDDLTVSGRPTMVHRIRAWWHGKSLTITTPEGHGRPSKRRDPRIRQAKTGSRPSRNTSKSSKKFGAPKGRIVKPSHHAKSMAWAGSLEEEHLVLTYPVLLDHLWGGGCAVPGGLQGALELMEPITRRLSPRQDILDFTTGCAETVKHVREFFDARAVGFEPNPYLCSDDATGPVSPLDPTRPDFGRNRFDYVACLEGLQDMKNRDQVLQAAAQALRPGGQMVIVDTVGSFERGNELSSEQAAANAGFGARVLSPGNYGKMMFDCGLEVVAEKSISSSYAFRTIRGWSNAIRQIKNRKMSRESKKLLHAQSLKSLARVNALKGGQARMMRMILTKRS